MTLAHRLMPLFLVAASVMGLATAPNAPGPPPCDRCEDLPSLLRELKEQEWLRDKFFQYSPWEKGYQLMAGDVQDLQTRVLAKFNEWLGTAAGGGGSRAGAPAMGTDPEDKCKLVIYETGEDGKKTTKPFDRKEMEKRYCPTILNFMLAHEKSHQKTCEALAAKGRKDFLLRPEFVAADEVKAFEEGIRVLEKAINDLAQKCGQQGTRATYKLDPNTQITPESVYGSKQEADRIAKELQRAREAIEKAMPKTGKKKGGKP